MQDLRFILDIPTGGILFRIIAGAESRKIKAERMGEDPNISEWKAQGKRHLQSWHVICRFWLPPRKQRNPRRQSNKR